MSEIFTINLAKPITSVKTLNSSSTNAEPSDYSGVNSAANAGQVKSVQGLETQKAVFSQVCQALKELVDKLNRFYDKVFAEHKEEIAKLAVEIARKILVQKVQQGDYEIESIVKEALKNAPTHQDVVVHLNQDDLAQLQKLKQDDPGSTLAGIRFVADPNIGRAECLLETPKGIIESLISEQLERIGKALEKAE
jgi:flagellar biosynthesis/type III secretory pathway protein FliH